MKNYLILIFVLFNCSIFFAQTFEQKAAEIAHNIDSITLSEKEKLKIAVEKVDKQLENGEIDLETAKTKRAEFADYHADRIEFLVREEKRKLDQLVSNRVEDRIAGKENDTIKLKTNRYSVTIKKNAETEEKSEKRTTSQFVFAFGLNTLSGDNGTFPDNLKVWKSRFYEYGITWNTRLNPNNNLTHLKYGLSLVYNNLRPEDNKILEESGEQTVLTPTEIDFKMNRFRTFYMNFPVHLEFDFSPTKTNNDGEKLFNSHRDFRIGLGGYAGVLINARNFFKYEEDGKKKKYSIKDDYNVNNFNYGVSAYIGYKQFSLYSKYDLQPLFENNPTDDRNFSIGVRWDLN